MPFDGFSLAPAREDLAAARIPPPRWNHFQRQMRLYRPGSGDRPPFFPWSVAALATTSALKLRAAHRLLNRKGVLEPRPSCRFAPAHRARQRARVAARRARRRRLRRPERLRRAARAAPRGARLGGRRAHAARRPATCPRSCRSPTERASCTSPPGRRGSSARRSCSRTCPRSSTACSTSAAARARRYDLLHANFFMSGLVGREVKRALGTPFVVTFHALGRVRRAAPGRRRRLPRRRASRSRSACVPRPTASIAECPQDDDDLVAALRRRPARDPRSCRAASTRRELWPVPTRPRRARALGIARDERVVLQLGRMVPRKGVEDVDPRRSRGSRASTACARGCSSSAARRRDPDPVATPEIGRLHGVADEEGVADRVDVHRAAAGATSCATTTAPPTSSSRRPGTSRSASRRSRRWRAGRRSSARRSAA